MKNKIEIYKNLSLVLFSILIGVLVTELGYRFYLIYVYKYKDVYRITTVDKDYAPSGNFAKPDNIDGLYPKNQIVTFLEYDYDNTPALIHKVKINNYGWVSRYDYALHKEPQEYRISILGDSLTACVNSDITWADELQNLLNADLVLKEQLHVHKFSILNLGVNGVGLQFMAEPVAQIAKKFNSDMVVVNFPLEDLYRRHYQPNKDEDKFKIIEHAYHEIDGIHVKLDCRNKPYNISNQACKLQLIWHAPPDTPVNRQFIRGVKRKLAKNLGQRILRSRHSYLIAKLRGSDLVLGNGRCSNYGLSLNPVATTLQCNDETENLNIGLKALQDIKALHNWDMLVTHNIVYWHLPVEIKPPIINKFSNLAKSCGIEITQMEEYLPIRMGQDEWRKWYNMPHDGHHWSNYGARIYAQAMYQRIRERLLQK